MTVLEQCSNARGSIEQYSALRRSDSDARALRELQTKIREHCDALQSAVERLAVLRGRQVRIAARFKTERLLEIAGRLLEEVVRTRRRPADAATFLRALKKLSEDATEALGTALDGYVRESHTVDAASMRQLEQIPRFSRQVQTLRDLQRTTPSRAAQLGVHELGVFLDEYARVRESLRDVEDLSMEVKAFLKEVDKGGARLELLTASVREWLSTKGLLGSVRLIISSTDR